MGKFSRKKRRRLRDFFSIKSKEEGAPGKRVVDVKDGKVRKVRDGYKKATVQTTIKDKLEVQLRNFETKDDYLANVVYVVKYETDPQNMLLGAHKKKREKADVEADLANEAHSRLYDNVLEYTSEELKTKEVKEKIRISLEDVLETAFRDKGIIVYDNYITPWRFKKKPSNKITGKAIKTASNNFEPYSIRETECITQLPLEEQQNIINIHARKYARSVANKPNSGNKDFRTEFWYRVGKIAFERSLENPGKSNLLDYVSRKEILTIKGGLEKEWYGRSGK